MYNKKLLCIAASLGNGGAERQMSILIELLNEKGIIPYVLTYGNIKDDYPTAAKMIRYNLFSDKQNHLWRNLKLLYYMFKIRPEIILSFWTDPNLLASIYKFFFRKCHVVVSERHVMQFPLKRRETFLYSLYRYVDVIVSNSRSQSEKLSLVYPNLVSKLVVITNFTNPNIYNVDKVHTVSNPLNITILARYSPQKNIIRFLNVIKALCEDKECPSFCCNWYGQNEKNGILLDYYRECVSYMRKLGLKNVHLCGYKTNVQAIISASDIMCLPSLYEGFSNTLSEAICLGKPILASAVSDNVYLVRDGYNGYIFDPIDEANMCSVIKKMLLAGNKLSEFGANSRILATKIFNKESFIDSYLNVLFGANV